MSYKSLFSRALASDPQRLHFAAHSHHLWPDASFEGHVQAWAEAAHFADRKWDVIFADVIPEAQGHIARELNLPDTSGLVFAPNTHDFLVRIFSSVERRPIRVLSTDGEFHSFRRQAERWAETGHIVLERVPVAPVASLGERLVERASSGAFDVVLVSQVFFRSGLVLDGLEALAALSRSEGPMVVIDGYHGFMASPTDLSGVADRVFYMSGGYKYAMAGEGAAFLHAPAGFGPRPEVTGWFAEFGDLQGPPGGVGHLADGGRFWGATFDATGLYRFNAVRRMLDEQGLDTARISAHAHGLMGQFQSAVREGRAGALDQAELINPLDGGGHGGTRARFLAFRHPDAQGWKAALMDANVITDVRDDVIRFGFGLYQDEDDVARLIEACARIIR